MVTQIGSNTEKNFTYQQLGEWLNFCFSACKQYYEIMLKICIVHPFAFDTTSPNHQDKCLILSLIFSSGGLPSLHRTKKLSLPLWKLNASTTTSLRPFPTSGTFLFVVPLDYSVSSPFFSNLPNSYWISIHAICSHKPVGTGRCHNAASSREASHLISE